MILRVITSGADHEIVERFRDRLVQRFLFHQQCVTWPYSTCIKGHIRNSSCVQMCIVFSDRFEERKPSDPFYPSDVKWPFDFASYVEATDDQKKRQILESIHAACLWAAGVNDWDVSPFNDARDRLLASNLRHLIVSRKGLRVEGLPTKVRIGVQMDLEQLEVYAIARRRRNAEDQRVPLYTTRNVTEDYENKYFDRFHSPGRGLLSFPTRDGEETVDLLSAIADDPPR